MIVITQEGQIHEHRQADMNPYQLQTLIGGYPEPVIIHRDDDSYLGMYMHSDGNDVTKLMNNGFKFNMVATYVLAEINSNSFLPIWGKVVLFRFNKTTAVDCDDYPFFPSMDEYYEEEGDYYFKKADYNMLNSIAMFRENFHNEKYTI